MKRSRHRSLNRLACPAWGNRSWHWLGAVFVIMGAVTRLHGDEVLHRESSGAPEVRSAALAPRFVDLGDIAPGIVYDIRYATTDNFLGERVYDRCRCLVREDVAGRLARVQRFLEAQGLGLKIWDCYRPHAVTRLMWDRVRDRRYVAHPREGSRHNRGVAVDLTLVNREGIALDMGTDHDDFSDRAHVGASDLGEAVHRNRRILVDAMGREGFRVLLTEWWHFDYENWREYPIEDVSLSSVIRKDGTTGPLDCP